MAEGNDPLQRLWQGQPATGEGAMPLEDIRARARRFEARIRRRNLVEYVAGACGIAVYAAFAMLFDNPVVRAGAVLTILGALVTMIQLHRRGRAASRAELAGVADSWADFHRAALARQRDALRDVWRWYLGPLVPGLVLFSIGIGAASQPGAAGIAATAGTLAIVGVTFLFIGALNRRAASQLQSRIDEIDEIGAARAAP